MSSDPSYPGVGGMVVGVLAFIASWAYAVASYGFLLGVGLGWIPAMFIGIIAAWLWPFIALAAIALALFIGYLATR